MPVESSSSNTGNETATIKVDDLPPLQELAGRNYANLKQTARIIGKSYQIVLKMIRPTVQGDGLPDKPPRLRAVLVGGQWRVYEDELRRFLTEGNAPGS